MGEITASGRRHGAGVLECTDGAMYRGRWRGDEPAGPGVETHSDGTSLRGADFHSGNMCSCQSPCSLYLHLQMICYRSTVGAQAEMANLPYMYCIVYHIHGIPILRICGGICQCHTHGLCSLSSMSTHCRLDWQCRVGRKYDVNYTRHLGLNKEH